MVLSSFVNRAPVPFVSTGSAGRWGIGRPARGSMVEQMDAMSASGTLFSIVNRTTTAVAKESWHLHRKSPGATCSYEDPYGEACEMPGVVCVEKHPALSVLARPNDFYTTQEYFESGQQHIDLTGEGWTIISRLGKVPYELWVARPDRMIVVTDRRDFLIGYIYVDPDGQEMPLRKEDVLSIRMPNPKNPYRGMGPVQTILSDIESGSASAEWNANFFRNGARPGGIVKLSRIMSDPEFDQLVERWNVNHLGAANANRTAFLEDGDWVDVKPMSITDMQFVETANLRRDTILLAFGMSKFAVGVVEDVNRATAEASKAWFGETMTVPRLDRWRGMLNNDFGPQFGPGLWTPDHSFVYSNPVPLDREAARADKLASAQVYAALVNTPGADPLWAAEVAGLPEPPPRPVIEATVEPPAPAIEPDKTPAAIGA
jgi:HK97 family phage portal protein